jgi:hypothetical protein
MQLFDGKGHFKSFRGCLVCNWEEAKYGPRTEGTSEKLNPVRWCIRILIHHSIKFCCPVGLTVHRKYCNPKINKYLVKGKVKVKSFLCFLAPRHGPVLGMWRYSSTHSLTSVLYGGEWLASRPSRFTPRERAPDTHWKGGWVGPRAGLDVMVKRRIPNPCRDSNTRSPNF